MNLFKSIFDFIKQRPYNQRIKLRIIIRILIRIIKLTNPYIYLSINIYCYEVEFVLNTGCHSIAYNPPLKFI